MSMLRNEFLRAALAVRPMTLPEIVRAGGKWKYKTLHNGMIAMVKQGLVVRERIPAGNRCARYRYSLVRGAQKPRIGAPDHKRRLVLMQIRRQALSTRDLAERCEMPVDSVRGIVWHLTRLGQVRRLPPGPGQRIGYRYAAVDVRGRCA